MDQKIAYLTIDDAPTEDMKEKIDFLDSKGIKAIWFCVGKNLEKFPEQAIYAIKKGHIIGNHSYSHPRFSNISVEEAKNQIKKTDELIENMYKKAEVSRPVKIFRFPHLDNGIKTEYSKCDWEDENVKEIQEFLKDLGYKQPKFENINYKWFKKAGFDKCINVDCSYDTFDWCLKENTEKFGYKDLTEEEIPKTECLKDVVERVLPFWKNKIEPELRAGKRLIISAHGNSLRAIVKFLDEISDEDIVGLNIPTGYPLVYELDENLKPIKNYYLGDAERIQREIEKVKKQGKSE